MIEVVDDGGTTLDENTGDCVEEVMVVSRVEYPYFDTLVSVVP